MALSGTTKVAGIIGWPVAHSLSPRLHGYWLDRYGIDGVYVPLPVRPADLVGALEALSKLGLVGANVTVPHKEKALAAVHSVSEEARRIGAVNTVVVLEDGELHGSITDGLGFLASMTEAIGGWRADAGPVVVIGAGGAARAVCAALLDDGAPEIRLVNRTRSRAEALARFLGGPIVVTSWADRSRALSGAAALVNTTTLGMEGSAPLDLDLAFLPGEAVVADIVYRPLITPLLAAAAARGHRIVDGLGMLLHQARPAFAAWFGVEPEVTRELRAFVLEGLAR